jgi:hypothetical protein
MKKLFLSVLQKGDKLPVIPGSLALEAHRDKFPI